jgi:hypothetical protein
MPAIVDRLARQLRSKGNKNSYGMAVGLLKKAGVLDSHGKLTKKGKKRNAMTAGQRAKARAAKASGKSPKSYKYNKRTNRAVLKKRRKKR